ncbi:MAG: hypothetical protein WBA67_06725, partial [Jannaschia sp.]
TPSALTPAQAQPALQPDDTTESFVMRWNAWADEANPDRSVINAVAEESDAINAFFEQYRKRYGYGRWVLDDLTQPGHWNHASSIIFGMAPHTRRLRKILTADHAALRFPSRAELVEEVRAEIDADEPTNRGPVNHAEMLYIGRIDESQQIRNAGIHLSTEASFVIETSGDLTLIVENITGMLNAYRLLAERPDPIDALMAVAAEDSALNLIRSTLVRHGVRSRDGALQRIQDALVEHEARRVRPSQDRRLMDLAHTELLAAWFEPDRPERLTAQGGAWYESRADMIEVWRSLGVQDLRLHPTILPSPDSEFAPAAEQIRVYRLLAEAFARDAARTRHSIIELESERLFRTLVSSDPDGRLAPALTLFYLHDTLFNSDFRADLQFRAALTFLAVHRHRACTGQWPESLAAIDPEIMRFDPIDPHSGQPFGYAVIDDQPTLWSAGPDRDNDDGRSILRRPALPEGELPQFQSRHWFTINEWNALSPEVQAEHDGDIPLFPPEG